jgi:hypothetical protein
MVIDQKHVQGITLCELFLDETNNRSVSIDLYPANLPDLIEAIKVLMKYATDGKQLVAMNDLHAMMQPYEEMYQSSLVVDDAVIQAELDAA